MAGAAGRRECPTCRGSCKCSSCGGDGRRTDVALAILTFGIGSNTEKCKVCNGGGKCPRCHGKGHIPRDRR